MSTKRVLTSSSSENSQDMAPVQVCNKNASYLSVPYSGTGPTRRQPWDLKGKVSDMESKIRTYQTKIKSLSEENEVLKGSLAQSKTKAAELEREVERQRRKIRVFCRVRPLEDGGLTKHIQLAPSDNKSIILAKTEETLRRITTSVSIGCSGLKLHSRRQVKHGGIQLLFSNGCNYICRSESAAEEELHGYVCFQIFDEISLLVQSALDGYNVCCFAYGQTGSGKTYTMEGEEVDDTRGVIPRAVQQIFRAGAKLQSQGWEFSFTASFVEIYNETLRDLLYSGKASKRPEHEIRKAANNEVTVTNLTYEKVYSEDQVLGLIALAKENRSTAQTALNDRSSRSHSVFQLQIEGVNSGRDVKCKCNYTIELVHWCSEVNSFLTMILLVSIRAAILCLVDLAGSERMVKSQSQGERFKEMTSINSSLSNLGIVITSLANKVNDCIIGTASSNKK
ncbi:hypothetical protein XENOCAPTIV_000890 [Xenoophorus captivus]|uniref:Kinesin motor domain-containing protein n=1 Tax=Xenoophorus captivus TaxID=1517983 RepID=A0ABV0RWI1_9TELE